MPTPNDGIRALIGDSCIRCGGIIGSWHTVCPLCGLYPEPTSRRVARWRAWHIAASLVLLLLGTLIIAGMAAWAMLPACEPAPANGGSCRSFLLFLRPTVPQLTMLASATVNGLQSGLVLLFAFQSFRPVPPQLGFRPLGRSMRVSAGATLGAVFVSLGFSYIYGLATTALGWEMLIPPPPDTNLLPRGPLVIISVFSLALWTPLVEEVFFRGFVMRGLWNQWGPGVSLVLSAVIFAAMHFSIAIMIPIFVTGLLLGGLYLYTKSIWPSIIVHAIQNSIALYLIFTAS